MSAELLCVLGVQSLPAAKRDRVRTSAAADGVSDENVIQNIQANMPPRQRPSR
jgi:hypothetical protein